jgi:hypothetical protein
MALTQGFHRLDSVRGPQRRLARLTGVSMAASGLPASCAWQG